MELQTQGKAFELALAELLTKHHVTRFAAVFSDPDRHPFLVDRFVHVRSGSTWTMNATLQLAQKVKDMVTDGRLKHTDDPENAPRPGDAHV